ncbi:hypothetical protein M422DRAFT_197939 [Sphaerobolus stellatus SS14]|nr:hypothetical protein M422DRAFT_197939 [Sphaerobolus stellatus SS14]
MALARLSLLLLTTATLASLFSTYLAVVQSPDALSPQGCRMSWMSPSYLLQDQFNSNWTRLARRYSLWLYREAGWDSADQLSGTPVLFIPGNAGSSRQVRSIASSASRQYYTTAGHVNPEFASMHLKPLDLFAVDFNEDFSALHGPTLLSQREYTSAAIAYILSLYPPNTKIIIMGHSMGGIVAMSLLPSSDISAVITMSTPHSLPPARLDRRIETIYESSWSALKNDSTPVLSICGGATDLMIPSDTCSMEHHDVDSYVGWRKTIFTTCMEGTWTGVGHREMVWCHQVRWRVARAALELGNAKTPAERGAVFDRWFRDVVKDESITSQLPSRISDATVTRLPAGHQLRLRHLQSQSNMYLLPVDTSSSSHFTLYVARGKIGSSSPHHASDLQVSVFRCAQTEANCKPLQPDTLRLLPNPVWGQRFPVDEEGVDESDGVIHFEASIQRQATHEPEWISVQVSGKPDPRSWIVGGIENVHDVILEDWRFAPLWRPIDIQLDPAKLSTRIRLPNLLSNALLVYRVTPKMAGSCKDAIFPPLLLHTSNTAESHFHTMDGYRPILIHTHSAGPFLNTPANLTHDVELQIFSSAECGVSEIQLNVDWKGSLSTWGLRYWTTLCAWSLGVVGVILLQAWITFELGDPFPTLMESMYKYISERMLPLGLLLFIFSCIPSKSELLLGNSGELLLAPLASLFLFVSSGCVALSCLLLQGLMSVLQGIQYIYGRFTSMFRRTSKETSTRQRNIWSFILILVLVALIIPSQVAFLVCFLIHLSTCTSQRPSVGSSQPQVESNAQKTHILLLIFWLLPLVGPVLVVWVRTLQTAGLTTPFDGDHDVLACVTFLLFVDFASNTAIPPFERAQSKKLEYLTYVVLSLLPLIAFFFGGRYTYRIYTISNIIVGFLCIARIGRRLLRS